MRWSDLARLYTPIIATPLQRTRRVPLVDAMPDAGARWGRPSAFSWSNEGAKASDPKQDVTNQTPSGAPSEYMRVVDAQLFLSSQTVKVRSPGDANQWVEVDRLTRMMFYFTEFPPKSVPGGMTPTLTTYYDMSFALHPPADEP